MRHEIPHLVFSTRGAEPKSGSDFVRQVVAASPGVGEVARRELSLRADMAGSVLQFHTGDEREALEIFTFSPLEEGPGGPWLLARAVSLGLYRKGSHHLLVPGVVLGEEVLLDWLEGNPLALAAPELRGELARGGFVFLDRHPGWEAKLEPLALGEGVAAAARAHNRRRLESLGGEGEATDRWLAAAYERLAAGERVACVAPDPRPETVETLLLHFHPDDRLELSFHTFYTHGRPVEYRLMGVLPEDEPRVRGQFRGLASIELARPPRVQGGSLGDKVCQLRRKSVPRFLAQLKDTRLTHLSRRRLHPLEPADARLALAHGLGEVLPPGGEERLELLLGRGGGGLGYRLAHLAGLWRKTPEAFLAAVDAAEQQSDKISHRQLEVFLERELETATEAQRWTLAALLTRPGVLESGAAGEEERLAAWRRLMPAGELEGLLGSLTPEQEAPAESLLAHWVVADACAGGPAAAPPSWAIFLRWLQRRGRPLTAHLAAVEEALATRPPGETHIAWRRLGELAWELGREEDTLRLLLRRELPHLTGAEARGRVGRVVERLLAGRRGLLPALGPHLGEPAVAAVLFTALTARLVRRPAEAGEIGSLLRQSLQRAEGLDAGAAEALGRLLAALARAPGARPSETEELLGRGCELLREVSGTFEREVSGTFGRVPGTLGREVSGTFAARALTAAAEELLPVCETARMPAERAAAVAAAAAVLKARLGRPAAAGADTALMSLAVRGRVLAAGLGRGGAAEALVVSWTTFLGQVRQGPAFRDPPPDARQWLALLQDELAAEPPRGAGEEDARLAAFLDLAWTLWSREPEDSAFRAALCCKLRWAAKLGAPKPRSMGWIPVPALLRSRSVQDHEAWHRERLRRRVPRELQSEAEALLKPVELRMPGL
jgi:hypothetical protein